MEEQKENERVPVVREIRSSCKREIVIEKSKPYLLCIFGNLCFAGFNIITKVSIDNKGMSRYVLIFYGNAFGTLAPLALIFERKIITKISLVVLRDIFILGLLGDVFGRTLYFAELEYTSPTIAAAMSNLMPSLALVFAVLCRMEKLEIAKHNGKAKIVGTFVAFGGATLMSVYKYKGVTLISMDNSLVHHSTTVSHQTTKPARSDKDWIKGSFMIFVAYVSFAAFYVLQGRTVKIYPAPIALTSLTCLSGTLLSAIVAAILDHKASSWRLSWDITLLAPLYNGIVFLALVIVVGAIFVILGLYAILWGKENEINEHSALEHSKVDQQSIEIKQ